MSEAGKVLVVEDDPEVNSLIGAYAQIAGYDYTAAYDGQSALREVRSGPPDLILLDVMLPDLDGFEICRRLKSQPHTAAIPVVILTALDPQECRSRGGQCEVVAMISKPFDPEELIRTIRGAVAMHAEADE